MRNIVFLGAMLAAIFIAFRTPFSAALTYWWFAIFRPHDYVYMDVSSLRLPLIATLVFFMVSFAKGVRPYLKDSLAKLMLAFLATLLISRFANGCSDMFVVIKPVQTLTIMFIGIFFTVAIIDNQKKLIYLIALIGLSLGFHAGKGGISSLLAGGTSNYGITHLTGLFTGSNAFAFGSVFFLFFLIFIFQQTYNPKSIELIPKALRTSPRFLRWGIVLVSLGTIYNVVSLESRGNALSLALGFGVLYLINSKRLKKILIWAPIAIVGVYFAPLPEGYKERLNSITVESEERDDSAASRPHFWKMAREMASDHPLGVGPFCYQEYFSFYDDSQGKFGNNRDVHSTHFKILAENGYLGILIWVLLLSFNYSRLFKLRKVVKSNPEHFHNWLFYKQLCDAMICCSSVFIFSGIFYTFVYGDYIWLVFGITMILTKLINKEMTENATIAKNQL